MMTYKEAILKNNPRFGSSGLAATVAEKDNSVAEAILVNQSPVMKAWFLMMLFNLALFLILLH